MDNISLGCFLTCEIFKSQNDFTSGLAGERSMSFKLLVSTKSQSTISKMTEV